MKTSHNTNPAIVSITPLSGPSIANVFAKLMLERQTPPNHLYGTSHMSSVEPVSHKRVRSVGAASSDNCRNDKQYMWEGNNWRIDAHILDVFYPYNTSTHSLAHNTIVGVRCTKQSFFLSYETQAQDLCYGDTSNG